MIKNENFKNTSGIIANLTADVAYLKTQVTQLLEYIKNHLGNANSAEGKSSYTELGDQEGSASKQNLGIAKYIDVDRTKIMQTDYQYKAHYFSEINGVTPETTNMVWDTTYSCWRFYAVYKD